MGSFQVSPPGCRAMPCRGPHGPHRCDQGASQASEWYAQCPTLPDYNINTLRARTHHAHPCPVLLFHESRFSRPLPFGNSGFGTLNNHNPPHLSIPQQLQPLTQHARLNYHNPPHLSTPQQPKPSSPQNPQQPQNSTLEHPSTTTTLYTPTASQQPQPTTPKHPSKTISHHT